MSQVEPLCDSRTVVQWLDDRELYEALVEARYLGPAGEFIFRATAWGPDLRTTVQDAQEQVQALGLAWELGTA